MRVREGKPHWGTEGTARLDTCLNLDDTYFFADAFAFLETIDLQKFDKSCVHKSLEIFITRHSQKTCEERSKADSRVPPSSVSISSSLFPAPPCTKDNPHRHEHRITSHFLPTQ